jgi:hypothetical protein
MKRRQDWNIPDPCRAGIRAVIIQENISHAAKEAFLKRMYRS